MNVCPDHWQQQSTKFTVTMGAQKWLGHVKTGLPKAFKPIPCSCTHVNSDATKLTIPNHKTPSSYFVINVSQETLARLHKVVLTYDRTMTNQTFKEKKQKAKKKKRCTDGNCHGNATSQANMWLVLAWVKNNSKHLSQGICNATEETCLTTERLCVIIQSNAMMIMRHQSRSSNSKSPNI